jgi:hypothetical protein
LEGPPKGADLGFVYPAVVQTESGTARTR